MSPAVRWCVVRCVVCGVWYSARVGGKRRRHGRGSGREAQGMATQSRAHSHGVTHHTRVRAQAERRTCRQEETRAAEASRCTQAHCGTHTRPPTHTAHHTRHATCHMPPHTKPPNHPHIDSSAAWCRHPLDTHMQTPQAHGTTHMPQARCLQHTLRHKQHSTHTHTLHAHALHAPCPIARHPPKPWQTPSACPPPSWSSPWPSPW